MDKSYKTRNRQIRGKLKEAAEGTIGIMGEEFAPAMLATLSGKLNVGIGFACVGEAVLIMDRLGADSEIVRNQHIASMKALEEAAGEAGADIEDILRHGFDLAENGAERGELADFWRETLKTLEGDADLAKSFALAGARNSSGIYLGALSYGEGRIAAYASIVTGCVIQRGYSRIRQRMLSSDDFQEAVFKLFPRIGDPSARDNSGLKSMPVEAVNLFMERHGKDYSPFISYGSARDPEKAEKRDFRKPKM